MNPIASFVLLCEGSSDAGLVPHLQALLVKYGAQEANGYADYSAGTVAEKLRRLASSGATADIVFVHRDADRSGHAARCREIESGSRAAGSAFTCLPVVPVTMTEAWLLTDPQAIRIVAGRPNGKDDLGIPSIGRLEGVRDPKTLLAEALVKASGSTGRRLREEKKQFSARRRVLLQRLDPSGPVRRLPSWMALEATIAKYAVSQLWTS